MGNLSSITTTPLLILEDDQDWAYRIKKAINLSNLETETFSSVNELELRIQQIDSLPVIIIDIRLNDGDEQRFNLDGLVFIRKLTSYLKPFALDVNNYPVYIVSGELSDGLIDMIQGQINIPREQFIRKINWAEEKESLVKDIEAKLNKYASKQTVIDDHTVCMIKACFDSKDIEQENMVHDITLDRPYEIKLEVTFTDTIKDIGLDGKNLTAYVDSYLFTSSTIPIPIEPQTSKLFTIPIIFSSKENIVKDVYYVYVPIYFIGRQLHVFKFGVRIN